MRTGRNQENTSLNVRARQRTDDVPPYVHRKSQPRPAPPSYGDTRYQYGNSQNNYTRPTAVGRIPPSIGVRCGECGSVYSNGSARYCPHCGSRR